MNDSNQSFWLRLAGLVFGLTIAVGAWRLHKPPNIPPVPEAATGRVIQVQSEAVVEPMVMTNFETIVKPMTMTNNEVVVNPEPTNPPSEDAELAWRLKIFAWTDKDPKAALAWASGLSDPNERQTALAAVCIELAGTNPALAVTNADVFNLGEQDTNLLPALVGQWAAKDLQGALDWSQNYSVNDQREDMLARVAFVEAQTDPAGAARLVVENISPGTTQDDAAISVLHQWALNDLAGATAWVENFPEGPLKTRAEDTLDHTSYDQAASDAPSQAGGNP